MTRAIVAAAFFLSLSLFALSAAAGNYGRWEVPGEYVYRAPMYLSAGPVTIETYDLTQGTDTALHLLNPYGQEVAMNDDWNGTLASYLEYTVPAGGTYTIIVRDATGFSHGYCKVTIDGIVERDVWTDVPVRGVPFQVGTSTTDWIDTVEVGDPSDTILYGFNSTGHLVAIDDDSSPFRPSSRLYGAYSFVVVNMYDPEDGPQRLVVNDAAGDTDGDSLGPQLEAQMCTCDSMSGSTCGIACAPPYTRHSIDSDGDGIRDDWETYGKRSDMPGEWDQRLPRYGANPARKDVFVEADYVHPTPQTTTQMSPNEALNAAAAYNRAGTAQVLKNRNGVDGVGLHVDIGRDDPSCGTACGDWGGAQEPIDVNYNYTNPDYAHFWQVRRGIFHYAKMVAGGGLSPTYNWYFRSAPNGGMVAHELGHNLGLLHGGLRSKANFNAKPNYQSRMNYLVGDLTFSLGEKPPLNPTSLCEENGLQITNQTDMAYLGAWDYTISSTPNAQGYWGVDWNRDGIISPCSSPRRADPCSAKGVHEPERGRYYSTDLSSYLAGAGGPTMVRAWNRLYLAARPSGFRWTDSDFVTGCDLYNGCPGIWTPGFPLYLPYQDWSISSPALGVHNWSGTDLLVAVDIRYHDEGYGLWPELVYSVMTQGETLLKQEEKITDGIFGEPLVANYQGKLVVVWRNGMNSQNGHVYLAEMSPSGFSFGLPRMQGSTNSQWQNPGVRAVLALASYPTPSGGTGLRGIFAEEDYPNGPVRLKWYEYTGNDYWVELTATGMDHSSRVYDTAIAHEHRIGLTYLQDATLPGGGRWYMMYKVYDPGATPADNGRLWVDMTRGAGPLNEVWENAGWYDNRFSMTTEGVSLYGWRPGAPESNVRLATHWLEDGRLTFRPFADGIHNIQLQDNNDFAVMERGICSSLTANCQEPLCTYGGDSACPQ